MRRFGRWLLIGLVLAIAIVLTRVRFLPADPDEPQPVTVGGASSGLIVPVKGVTPAALTDSFGDPRSGQRIHGALDIPAARGTRVLAATGGTIEKLFESEAGGHTIYVRSADRSRVYYYAHLDSYAAGLLEGMTVSQGQVIGRVGSSGNADPAAPHLHFEIKRMSPGERWYQGQAINPYPVLIGGAIDRDRNRE